MSIKNLINDVIASGIHHFEDTVIELKFKVLNIFCLIGLFVTFLSFFTAHVTLSTIFTTDYVLQYIGILLSLVLLLVLRWTKKIDLVAQFALFMVTVLSLFLVYTGGTYAVSIVWILILPPLFFFLTDRKKGVFWNVLTFGLVWLLAGLKFSHIITLHYTYGQIAEVSIAYIETVLLTYVYALLLDLEQKSIHDKNIRLESAVNDLNYRNKERDEVQVQLQSSNIALRDQLGEIKKLNDIMIGRESKMMALKKEIEDLKQQLSMK